MEGLQYMRKEFCNLSERYNKMADIQHEEGMDLISRHLLVFAEAIINEESQICEKSEKENSLQKKLQCAEYRFALYCILQCRSSNSSKYYADFKYLADVIKYTPPSEVRLTSFLIELMLSKKILNSDILTSLEKNSCYWEYSEEFDELWINFAQYLEFADKVGEAIATYKKLFLRRPIHLILIKKLFLYNTLTEQEQLNLYKTGAFKSNRTVEKTLMAGILCARIGSEIDSDSILQDYTDSVDHSIDFDRRYNLGETILFSMNNRVIKAKDVISVVCRSFPARCLPTEVALSRLNLTIYAYCFWNSRMYDYALALCKIMLGTGYYFVKEVIPVYVGCCLVLGLFPLLLTLHDDLEKVDASTEIKSYVVGAISLAKKEYNNAIDAFRYTYENRTSVIDGLYLSAGAALVKCYLFGYSSSIKATQILNTFKITMLGSPWPLVSLAVQASRGERYQLALQFLDKAKEILPNDVLVLYETGVVLTLMKRFDEAIHFFNLCIRSVYQTDPALLFDHFLDVPDTEYNFNAKRENNDENSNTEQKDTLIVLKSLLTDESWTRLPSIAFQSDSIGGIFYNHHKRYSETLALCLLRKYLAMDLGNRDDTNQDDVNRNDTNQDDVNRDESRNILNRIKCIAKFNIRMYPMATDSLIVLILVLILMGNIDQAAAIVNDTSLNLNHPRLERLRKTVHHPCSSQCSFHSAKSDSRSTDNEEIETMKHGGKR